MPSDLGEVKRPSGEATQTNDNNKPGEGKTQRGEKVRWGFTHELVTETHLRGGMR